MTTQESSKTRFVDAKLKAEAEKYLIACGLKLSIKKDPAKFIASVADSRFVRSLQRTTREGYYQSIALGISTYLYIDSHAERSALLNACAQRLRTKRNSATSDIALVLRSIINYGETTKKEREKHRQYWSRDARIASELIHNRVAPGRIVEELKSKGLRITGSPKAAGATGIGKETAPRKKIATPDIGLSAKVRTALTGLDKNSVLIIALQKRTDGKEPAYNTNMMVIPKVESVIELSAWKQLDRTRRLRSGEVQRIRVH